MRYYTFRLSMEPRVLQRLYQGTVQRVSILCEQGLRIELPASRLRPFVTHSGIQGRFRLITDDNHAFLDLERLG